MYASRIRCRSLRSRMSLGLQAANGSQAQLWNAPASYDRSGLVICADPTAHGPNEGALSYQSLHHLFTCNLGSVSL
jgi:hypothetical protein